MRRFLVLLIVIFAASDILQTGMSLGPGLSVKNALLYPIALGLLFRMALTGRFRMRLPAVNVAFIVWFAYALLTWIVCVTVIHYPGYPALASFVELKSVLFDSALYFFIYFYGLESEADFLLVTRTLALAIGVANILTLADLAGIIHLGITVGSAGVEADRVFGVFGHANDTATLIVCLLPMLVAVAVTSRGPLKLLWYAGAFASLAVMILTISRGAYVGFAVGYGAAVWLCRRYLPTGRVVSWTLIGLTGIAVALGLAAVLVPDVLQVLLGRLLNQSMASSIAVASSGRTTVWMNALAVMMAHPITLLTGFGWRVYETMFVLVTHNYYLDQWFGLGLVGLGCLLTILYQTVSTASRAVAAASPQMRPFMLALVFGALGLSICIFFENLDKPWAYVWVYVGFTLRAAADIVERAERRATQRAVAGLGPRSGVAADFAAPARMSSAVGEPRR